MYEIVPRGLEALTKTRACKASVGEKIRGEIRDPATSKQFGEPL